MRRTLAIVVVLAAPFAAAGAGIMGSGIGDGGANIVGGAITGASIAPAAAAGLVIDPATTFWLYPDYTGSGLSQLSPSVTINGTVMTPLLDCSLTNVSGTSLSCTTGGTFTEGGSGASPASALTPFTDGTGARTFSGKAYEAASSSVANITTEDFVFEFLVKSGETAAPGYIYDKRNATSGIHALWTGATQFQFSINDGSSADTCTMNVANDAWQYITVFVNHDWASTSGLRCLSNATTAAIDSDAATLGTLTTTAVATIGAQDSTSSYVSPSTQPIALVRAWTCSACLADNTTDQDTFSKERFARLTGTYPVSAAGTAAPSTLTRATAKFLDVMDSSDVRRLFRVYNSWIGISRRKELVGGEYVKGILIEPSHTNLCLQSETFASASWTENNIDVVSEGSTTAVDQAATADTLESTDGAGSVEHFMRQAITLTAATYTASAYVKAGAGTATHAWIRDNTVANAIGWINLSTCAAGTKGAGASRLHAENWGNGWCRVGITFTGTVAAHDIDIGYSNADNVTTYDDGTNANSDLIVWGAQVEAQPLPLSYVPTTTGSATSNADNLQYSATSNVNNSGSATYSIDNLLPSFSAVSAINGIFNTRVDANNGENATVYGETQIRADANVGGVTQWSYVYSFDGTNGEKHNYHLTRETNNVRFFVDSVSAGATDTSATMTPTTGGVIYLGAVAGIWYTFGLISNVHIYNDVRTP